MAWRRAFKNFEIDSVRQFAGDVARFVGIFHVLSNYGVNVTFCVGPSMMPTINPAGNLVLIDSFNYRLRGAPYKNGDVVISTCPYDADKTVCKRVAAVEGEYVRVRGPHGMGLNSDRIKIPPGHVWLAGDNASNSTDSRTYGPVSLGLIKGKVFWKMSLRPWTFEEVRSETRKSP